MNSDHNFWGKDHMDLLEKSFHAAMLTTYEEGVKHGYIPTLFLQMLHQYGGVETAKRLLASNEPQTGLYRMWELGLLGETVEAHVILEKYRPLFSAEEIEEARWRLDELGYFR